MKNVIGSIILGVIALTCFFLSYRQLHEKGYLFNNAYIFASKKERETMDKKPHYRQSGSVFLLLGIICLLIVLDLIFQIAWLFYCEMGVAAAVIIYAIGSSVAIEKRMR